MTPLDTESQEESWELTPNLSETSPEEGETSEQRLEETPARQTEQTERRYPKRVHRPPCRILKFFFNVILFIGVGLYSKVHLYIFCIYLHVCWNNSFCLCGTQMGTLDGVWAPTYQNCVS